MANEESGQTPLTATVGERLGEKAHARQVLERASTVGGEAGLGAGGGADALWGGEGARRASGHRGRWHAAGWLAFFSAVGTWVLIDSLARRAVRWPRRRLARRRRASWRWPA